MFVKYRQLEEEEKQYWINKKAALGACKTPAGPSTSGVTTG